MLTSSLRAFDESSLKELGSQSEQLRRSLRGKEEVLPKGYGCWKSRLLTVAERLPGMLATDPFP